MLGIYFVLYILTLLKFSPPPNASSGFLLYIIYLYDYVNVCVRVHSLQQKIVSLILLNEKEKVFLVISCVCSSEGENSFSLCIEDAILSLAGFD